MIGSLRHAGQTHGLTLKELDAALRRGVDQDGYRAKILSDPDSLLKAKLHDPAPWWEQGGDLPERSSTGSPAPSQRSVQSTS